MNFVNKKEINQNYQVGLGTLNIKMNIPKQTYYFGEEIDIQTNVVKDGCFLNLGKALMFFKNRVCEFNNEKNIKI